MTLEVLLAACALMTDAMTIRRLSREASFSPEDIRRLTAAYDAALELLRLQDRSDPVTELVATKIIEVFRAGELDPPRLCARALKELGVPLPD